MSDLENNGAVGQGSSNWVEWAGGECPVPGNMVQYRMRDGYEDFGPMGTRNGWLADDLIWYHDNDFIDIIAYRPVSPTLPAVLS